MRRPRRPPRRAVRLYLHGFMPVERLSVSDRNTASWLGLIEHFLTFGWRVVATGCEEGAMVVHLRL